MDEGFDLYPPLLEDESCKWQAFLRAVADKYEHIPMLWSVHMREMSVFFTFPLSARTQYAEKYLKMMSGS